MSKEVYSIENQEKFNVGMVVGYVLGTFKGTIHEKEIEDWTYDVEISNLACAIYNRVKNKGCSNQQIVEEVNSYFSNEHDVNRLPNAEKDEEYQDFWYGAECGNYFGLPTKESLEKSNKAMELFMEQMKFGFVHEVIEANKLV